MTPEVNAGRDSCVSITCKMVVHLIALRPASGDPAYCEKWSSLWIERVAISFPSDSLRRSASESCTLPGQEARVKRTQRCQSVMTGRREAVVIISDEGAL